MSTKALVRYLLGASLLASAPLVSADANDPWLTAKAKIALLTADGVSATAVNVDTVDGQVTLHGKVATAQEKAQAEAAVKGVEGVKGIKNLLQVVPEAKKDVTNASDDAIKDSGSSALQSDPGLSGVKVASVNKGVVLLSGKAPDVMAKLKAIELAAAAPGVRRVSSEIQAE